MEVDSSSADSPTLPEFLTLCLSYPSSPALLRTAIRRCLPDAADIARILETLDVWLGQWAGREVPLMPSKKSLEKNKHGVFVIDIKRESKRGKGDGTVPPVNEVCFYTIFSFLNILVTDSRRADCPISSGHLGFFSSRHPSTRARSSYFTPYQRPCGV